MVGRPPPSPRAARWYLAACALVTLASARLFYTAMLQQTRGRWSAPLDDVFIHFDYARATARGFPFTWSEGNGFSSGNTSLTYPFALALGYWAGLRDARLMTWAAALAGASVLGFLWSVGGLFRRLPRPALLFAPAALFSVGALGWSLWSGMEVAAFLGVWAIALALARELGEGRLPSRAGGWALGAAGALVVTTRPEGLTSVALIVAFVLPAVVRRGGVAGGVRVAARSLAPPLGALALQAAANLVFTGETAANGAVVKLALYNPYLSADAKLADYLFNLQYAFDRVHLHHFGEPLESAHVGLHDAIVWLRLGGPFEGLEPYGYVPLGLALVALLDRRVRAGAMLLLTSAAAWAAFVALNGQVRWQNERYLMPAVAWELTAAALGAAALVFPPRGRARPLRAALGAGLVFHFVAAFWEGERIQYKDQVWFFARACRNILDQHLSVGEKLGEMRPPPRRVLVGDAGAIPYASDLPAFDLIGLGGYHGLPLARAGVQGLAATLELLERVPPADRPDVMAIYPDWWGPLPDWFGRKIFGVTVPGNVICGGAEKVVYETNWRLLGTGAKPRALPPGEVVVDEIDTADLVSEKAHHYSFPHPQGGFTDMRVLPDPAAPERDLWDGGRRIPVGRPEAASFGPQVPADRPTHVVLRTTADTPFRLAIDAGACRRELVVARAEGWVERAIELPAGCAAPGTQLRLTSLKGEWVDYHLWVSTPASPR